MNIHQVKQYLFNNLRYGENSHRNNLLKNTYGVVRLLEMPDTTKVWGIDISHWNVPPVNLKRMIELYNLKFVIIKGCDGAVNSRYYLEHVAVAKEAGIPWGTYMWLYPNNKVSIDAQVNAWYARTQYDFPPMGIFIDAEQTYYGGQLANPVASDLRMAHDKWKVKTNNVGTTYTSPYYATAYLQGFDWSREPLWIANYGVPSPSTPQSKIWDFWQFTATLDGKQLDPLGNYELDGDYFKGTLEQFNARYGITPPPTGGTMETWKCKVNGLAYRSGNGTTYPQIDTLNIGDIVEGVLSGWIHGSRIIRTNGDVVIKDGWCSSSSTYMERIVIPPPTTTLPDLKVTIEAVGYPTTITIIHPNA